MAQWVALIARVGQAISPQDMLLDAEFEAHQPWRVRVDILEQPGAVARLVRALATLHAYMVAMQIVGHEEGRRTIDVAFTAPVSVTADVIRAAVMSVGRNAHVGEGSEDDALDLPTRILDGAAALVKTPEWTPLAAAELVEADEVEVTSATEGEDDSPRRPAAAVDARPARRPATQLGSVRPGRAHQGLGVVAAVLGHRNDDR